MNKLMKEIDSALEMTILWADLHDDKHTPEDAIKEVLEEVKKELLACKDYVSLRKAVEKWFV